MKIMSVFNPGFQPPFILRERTFDDLRNEIVGTDPAQEYAIQSVTSNSVTIFLNSIPASAYTLSADVLANLATLSGLNIPAFAEDYHDILVYGAMATELYKMEKYDKSEKNEQLFDKRLSQLRYYYAKSAYLDIVPGGRAENELLSSVAGGGGGGGGGGTSTVSTAINFVAIGPGQATVNPSTVTGIGGSIQLQDSSGLAVNNGGMVIFGCNTGSAKNFAAIKGLLVDASNNSLGSISFSTRAVNTDATLTERMRISNTGQVNVLGATANGVFNFVVSGARTALEAFSEPYALEVSFSVAQVGTDGFFLGVADNGGIGGNGVFTISKASGAGVLSISSAGLVTIPGGQIKFPAVQIPSSDVNTLDDYKRGTFIPSLQFGGLSTGITYTTQLGTFVKIGNVVHGWIRITLSSKGAANGVATIIGFPYTELSGVGASGGSFGFFASFAAGVTVTPSFYIVGTTLSIFTSAAGGSSQLTDASFTNTSDMIFSFMYKVS